MKKQKTIKYTKKIISLDEADETTALRRIVIKRDESHLNPREGWDTMFTIHSGCSQLASDKGAFDPVVDYGNSPDEAKFTDGVCAFPFYAYIHSGMALSMTPFNDPWDSGCAGFIYVNKEKFCKDMGLKRFSRAKAYECAKGEIDVLNQYINGEVYGYVEQTRETPDDDWKDGDSCWGFYGEDSIPDMLSDAGAYKDGTLVCEDDDAYISMSTVTIEVAVREEANPAVAAA